MRIIVATSSYPTHPDEAVNAGVFVRDIVGQMVTQGHSVHVLTPRKQSTILGSPAPVRTFGWGGNEPVLTRLNPTNLLDLARLGWLMLGGRLALRQLIAEVHADAVCAMWAIPAGYWAAGAKGPYVVWALGSDIWGAARYPMGVRTIRHVLRGASHVFANSHFLMQRVEQLSGRSCEFLAAGRILPVLTTPAANLPPGGPHFLFVGRWDRAKGVDTLLHAMEIVTRRAKGAHLHIFGGGPLEHEIRSLASQGELRTSVTVYGYASPTTAVAYLKACDALVISSRIESIPVLYSDAMQCGCPVICTDVGDLGKLVSTQGTGYLCRPEDPESLANAMCEFAAGAANQRQRYAEALRKAATMFDPSRSAARCLEVLADARARIDA